jgi:hypothetical protein
MATNSPAGSSDPAAAPSLAELARVERTAHVIGRPVPIPKRVMRPPFTWDDAVPGRSFLPLEYVITPDAAAHFQSLCRGLVPAATAPVPDTVPAVFFADEPMQCLNTLFAQSGRLHAGHKIEGLGPVPVGATVRSRAIVLDRRDQSGKQFVDVVCTVAVVEGALETPAVRITATLLL